MSDLLVEPRQPFLLGPHVIFKLVAPGCKVGERGGQLGEQQLSTGECRFGFRNASVQPAALFDP